MSLNKPRTLFGIHSFTPISRTTGLPYGVAKVLGNANVASERDSIDLFGGSNPNAWDSEDGNINNDIALNVKEFHPMFFELAGFNKTANAAEATGAVTTLTNKLNETVQSATIGITTATLEAGETTELKDGYYVVKAASATSVDVYAATDLYFNDGTALTYQNDLAKITASPITIETDTAVSIPSLGVELTGGSGTIGMTENDTATFEVRSVNEGSTEYTYDGDPTPIEFGGFFFSQKKTNGEYQYLYCPRCKFITFPYGMTEKEWEGSDITIKVLYDTAAGYSKKILDLIKDVS